MRPLTALLVACALLAGGCAGEETEAGRPKGEAPAPRRADVQVGVPDAADLTSKPTVRVPRGVRPPSELRTRDLVPGDGPVLRPGSQVTVHYVGVAWSTGRQFDASWDRGEPFPFPLGQGRVIPGWDRGLVGMRVGGRRLLVVPPGLGYGPQGSGPIKPNETLVFVVDARRVVPASGGQPASPPPGG